MTTTIQLIASELNCFGKVRMRIWPCMFQGSGLAANPPRRVSPLSPSLVPPSSPVLFLPPPRASLGSSLVLKGFGIGPQIFQHGAKWKGSGQVLNLSAASLGPFKIKTSKMVLQRFGAIPHFFQHGTNWKNIARVPNPFGSLLGSLKMKGAKAVSKGFGT